MGTEQLRELASISNNNRENLQCKYNLGHTPLHIDALKNFKNIAKKQRLFLMLILLPDYFPLFSSPSLLPLYLYSANNS